MKPIFYLFHREALGLHRQLQHRVGVHLLVDRLPRLSRQGAAGKDARSGRKDLGLAKFRRILEIDFEIGHREASFVDGQTFQPEKAQARCSSASRRLRRLRHRLSGLILLLSNG